MTDTTTAPAPQIWLMPDPDGEGWIAVCDVHVPDRTATGTGRDPDEALAALAVDLLEKIASTGDEVTATVEWGGSAWQATGYDAGGSAWQATGYDGGEITADGPTVAFAFARLCQKIASEWPPPAEPAPDVAPASDPEPGLVAPETPPETTAGTAPQTAGTDRLADRLAARRPAP
jgi:hypothetical protein